MDNSEILLKSFLIGLGFSVPWGVAAWLKWQSMKGGTVIPAGASTLAYGGSVGIFINIFCLVSFIQFIPKLGWGIIVSVVIMFHVGGWIATLIERRIYCNEEMMTSILGGAYVYTQRYGPDQAVSIILEVVPTWWLKLMPQKWRTEVLAGITAIVSDPESLQAEESSDLT
jgi:hypothetical protein